MVLFGPKWRYFFAAVKSQKSEKSEPWAQNVIQAFRTGSQALKILKNHAKMNGEIIFFRKKILIVVIFSIIMIIMIIIIKKILEKTIPGNKDAARWRVTRAAH